jgi:hypothetical protein
VGNGSYHYTRKEVERTTGKLSDVLGVFKLDEYVTSLEMKVVHGFSNVERDVTFLDDVNDIADPLGWKSNAGLIRSAIRVHKRFCADKPVRCHRNSDLAGGNFAFDRLANVRERAMIL